MKKTITVFGSSFPKPGDEEYILAYKLGRFLGESNFNVCSGGYRGIMDAVSKGVTETGGEAIGITVDLYNVKPSENLTKEIKCSSLFERIEKLIDTGDGYIILPGGTGTLVELAVVWEFMNKNMMNSKPVACIGDFWREVVKSIDERMKFEGRRTGLVKLFNGIEETVEFMKGYFRNMDE